MRRKESFAGLARELDACGFQIEDIDFIVMDAIHTALDYVGAQLAWEDESEFKRKLSDAMKRV